MANYVALTNIDFGKDGEKKIGEIISNPSKQLIEGYSVIPEDIYKKIIGRSEDKLSEGKLAEDAFQEAKAEILPGYRTEFELEAQQKKLDAGVPDKNSATNFIPQSLVEKSESKSKSAEKREASQKEAIQKKEAEKEADKDDESLASMRGPVKSGGSGASSK